MIDTPMMNDHPQKETQRFFSTIAGWERLYQHSTLSFLALKNADRLYFSRARVELAGAAGSDTTPRQFETDQVVAGRMPLSAAGLTARQFAEGVIERQLTIAGRQIEFPTDGRDGVGAMFMEFDPEHLRNRSRAPVLTFDGDVYGNFANREMVNWHLRHWAYDSVEELAAEFGLPGSDLARPRAEIVATPIIDFHASSHVKNGNAHLALVLPAQADHSDVLLAYQLIDAEGLERRERVPGTALNWKRDGDLAIGHTDIPLAGAEAVQAYASYAGSAQRSVVLGDPSRSPNMRWLILEEIDTELEVTREFLLRDYAVLKKKEAASRDLEQGVSWLLWAAGFAVLHPNTKPLEQNVDVLAQTPAGHVVVIECTTTSLSRANKLAQFDQRVQSLHKRLKLNGFEKVEVLALGVTSIPRDEAQVDIKESAKAGVLIITRDDLEGLLDRTITPLDADEVFRELQHELARLRSHDPPWPGGIART